MLDVIVSMSRMNLSKALSTTLLLNSLTTTVHNFSTSSRYLLSYGLKDYLDFKRIAVLFAVETVILPAG